MSRYHAAAIQTAFEAPADRSGIGERVRRMVSMAEQTMMAYEPFFDVRLFAFPEFSHVVPVHDTVEKLDRLLAVELPGEHAEPYLRFCRANGCFVQTGTFIERDPRWPGVLFNTTLLVGPGGVLSRYRKVNPWIPWEVHASPHDVPGYDQPFFPVVETEIGRLGCAICYDWLFPETIRELAFQGCEVAIRVSAYMDPWGATPPMDWWTLFNRARAAENTLYVVAANQGAALRDYPPFSWPGASMVVDYDGRILAQADAGPGEKVVVAPIDVGQLRAERERRRGHDMRGHLRTEAYRYMQSPHLPGAAGAPISIQEIEGRIREGRRRRGP